MEFHFRKARVSEAKAIWALIEGYADQGLLLSRSMDDIFRHIRDFSVALTKKNRVVGVCALTFFTERFAEIRSLGVLDWYQGKGLGVGLVDFVLKESKDYEIPFVFTLTYIPQFFQKQGFKRMEKQDLPHKIWRDCVRCEYSSDCNEDALVYIHRK